MWKISWFWLMLCFSQRIFFFFHFAICLVHLQKESSYHGDRCINVNIILQFFIAQSLHHPKELTNVKSLELLTNILKTDYTSYTLWGLLV